MVKEYCFRCKKVVYPTDKIGPLKEGAFYHNGCFKCYICGTRLMLKSYCLNRNDIADQEVYCNNHVPTATPHEPIPFRANLSNQSNGNGNVSSNGGSPSPVANGKPPTNGHPPVVTEGGNGYSYSGDMKIQHALKAQRIQKPYPKIHHAGAKYLLDYDAQTRLELDQRREEDRLYEEFAKQREMDEHMLKQETKEEWERALTQLAARYDRESHKGVKAREDLIRQLTVKRDLKRETMAARRKERERNATSELVDKQSKEMMDLFRQHRVQIQTLERTQNGHVVDENGVNGVEGHHGTHVNGVNGNGVVRAVDVSPVGSGGSGGSEGGVSYPPTPPPPFPPLAKKRDVYRDTSVFEMVDQTAISVAQAEQKTFTDLIFALTQSCRSDVEKARAIYRWITVKNLNLMEFDARDDPNTPMGILRGIKYGTESYHVLFKRLCAYAGLHCVVIKGYSKSAGYQPGMRFEDNRFRNTWNAVYLDGSWRFVQCNWGARHLVNAKEPPSPARPTNGGRAENLRYEYDDHYFMTDPEEFIYEFFPAAPEWQLLKRPISQREFEELPFVRSLFFRYGLSFADPHLRAIVFADKTGAATVAINMSPEAISSLIFHYNLRFYNNEENQYNGINLKRFVMQSVVGHSVVFRVHTPSRNEFLLDIFANAVTAGEYLTGQPMKFKSVCKFKVLCEHLNVIMVPLPECASGEWGPAKAYRLFGLIPLSHEDAIINSNQNLEIRFRMSKQLAEFVASLHKNGNEDRKLSKYVSHVVRGDQVIFRVAFPEEGQYGLDIYTREGGGARTGDRHLLTHCCKYLINARL